MQSTPAGHGTRLDGLGITPIGSRSLQLSRPRSASERVYTPGDSDLSDYTGHARERFHGRRGDAAETLAIAPPPQRPHEPEILPVFVQQTLEEQHGVSVVAAPQTRSQ